jgi:hypothetical protein
MNGNLKFVPLGFKFSLIQVLYEELGFFLKKKQKQS